MKRPAHIDGHTHICCGNKQSQCDDCPMKEMDRVAQEKYVADLMSRAKELLMLHDSGIMIHKNEYANVLRWLVARG